MAELGRNGAARILGLAAAGDPQSIAKDENLWTALDVYCATSGLLWMPETGARTANMYHEVIEIPSSLLGASASATWERLCSQQM